MFQNLKLSYTIFGFLIIFSIAPVLTLSYFSLHKSQEAIQQQVFDHLVFARNLKIEQVKKGLESIRKEAQLLAMMPWTKEAMKGFSTSFVSLGKEIENRNKYKNSLINFYGHNIQDKFRLDMPKDIKEQLDLFTTEALFLQYHYLSNNPYIMDYKYKLNNAGDGSVWSTQHEKFHPWFLNYMEKYNYSDIYLVDLQTSNIVYSTAKKIDIGITLEKSFYANSLLDDCYQAARVTSSKEFTKITDMEKHIPSYNFPVNFVSVPIFDHEQKIGVLIMQISPEKINNLVLDKEGFCQTYLVGKDGTMRSNSHFFLENPSLYYSTMKKIGMPEDQLKEVKSKRTTVLLQKIETLGVKKASLGNKGTDIFVSYYGEPVISAYSYLHDSDLNWILVSEKNVASSFIYSNSLQQWIVFSSIIAVVAILICAYFLSNRVTSDINNIVYSLSDELWQFQGQVQNIGRSLENIYTQQASMVKQVEEKLSLLNAMSSVNSDNTKEANKITILMFNHIKESIHNMNNVMNSINNIGVHTQETGTILELIDDIAKETHVVSVNASIRAAHEQNDSFSMVANEVRKLAFKSSDAVHKTDANIKLAKGLAHETSQTANYTAKSLQEIQSDIRKTISILEEISIASQEQFNDLQGVSSFVDNICYSQEVLGDAVLKTSEIASQLNYRITGILDGLKNISQGKRAS